MARPRDRQKLDAVKVVETLDNLHARVSERFPASGLAMVCARLADTGRQTAARARRIGRPYLLLRALVVLIIVGGVALEFALAWRLDWSAALRAREGFDLAQGLEAAINLALLSGAAAWFLSSLERRWKQQRVQVALHELRSFCHVIDMHQLTKDPSVILGPRTRHSPPREMSNFQLSRYLDYCAEMLALTAKLAALYAGETDDPVIIAAVNDIETLASDLGRKIDLGLQDIAAGDRPVGRRRALRRLLDHAGHGRHAAIDLAGRNDAVLVGLAFRHFLDADDIAAADLVVEVDQLAEAGALGVDDDVRQHDREGLVADDVTGAPDGVAQAQGGHLAHEAHLAGLGQLGAQLFKDLDLALGFQLRLKLDLMIEIVLDRALRAAGDEDEVFDARLATFLDNVGKNWSIDDVQQFLWRGLGARQDTRTETGDRKNSFANGFHGHLVCGHGLLFLGAKSHERHHCSVKFASLKPLGTSGRGILGRAC